MSFPEIDVSFLFVSILLTIIIKLEIEVKLKTGNKKTTYKDRK